MGVLLELGKGAKASATHALRAFDLAASKGYAPALDALERMGV